MKIREVIDVSSYALVSALREEERLLMEKWKEELLLRFAGKS